MKSQNKNFSKNLQAFSYVKTSAIILIAAILICGVSYVVNTDSFKMMRARSLTKSAPMYDISGLVLWLETTSKDSFKPTIVDSLSNVKVDVWNDLSKKNNATQTVAQNQPIYVPKALNSLPVLRFKKANSQYLNLPEGTVPYNNSAYTAFFVSRVASYGPHGLLGSGNYSDNQTNAFRYNENGIGNYWHAMDILSNGDLIKPNQVNVMTFYYNLLGRKIFINGVLNNSDTATGNQATEINNTVGRACPSCIEDGMGEFMDGDIGEIIVFNRALSDGDRKSVEKYLSKKWGV